MTSTQGNVQADLESLRSDLRRLSEQVSGIVESRSQPAWRVMSDATAKGQEAMHAVGEVGHTMVDAIDESLRKRPYTTLVLAVVIGFLFGATWRR
jgi:ElaB/YqjD/DUF883 family membrane-anchored ribosome-binding protein